MPSYLTLCLKVTRTWRTAAQHKYTFIGSWSPSTLAVANAAQRQAIDAGIPDWVWVITPGFDAGSPAMAQIEASHGYLGNRYPASLFTTYKPALACGDNVLLRRS